MLIVYFVSRNRGQQSEVYAYQDDDDRVENEWDDDWRVSDEIADEDVGDIHIVARDDLDEDDYEDQDDDEFERYAHREQDDAGEIGDEQDDQDNISDVIVLHIMSGLSSRLAGDKINSAAQACGMKFGEMNIFHRHDENGRTQFSMTNMLEPGTFDPDSMYELKTPGLTLFMQRNSKADNVANFEDMLECAYHMSEMLGAQLCNQQRQPLTKSDAERYREIALDFDR